MAAENMIIGQWEHAKRIAKELGFWIQYSGAEAEWPTDPTEYTMVSDDGKLICTTRSVADLEQQVLIIKNAIAATGKQQAKIVEANVGKRRWWK